MTLLHADQIRCSSTLRTPTTNSSVPLATSHKHTPCIASMAATRISGLSPSPLSFYVNTISALDHLVRFLARCKIGQRHTPPITRQTSPLFPLVNLAPPHCIAGTTRLPSARSPTLASHPRSHTVCPAHRFPLCRISVRPRRHSHQMTASKQVGRQRLERSPQWEVPSA